MVFGSDNKLAPNPLFADGFRTSANVIYAAIVGVPPNLVSNDVALARAHLRDRISARPPRRSRPGAEPNA